VPSDTDRQSYRRVGNRSSVTIPLTSHGQLIGFISFGTLTFEHAWSAHTLDRLKLVGTIVANSLSRRQAHQSLQHALAEVHRLREQLALENVQLRREVRTLKGPRMIAGESVAAKQVLAQIEQVAPTTATVLMLGETGCGKEVFAEAIHDFSPRRHKPIVRVNCAAIPTALIESELFGRERGAYTGALSRQIGRFEVAEGTTIFLDEVGDLPLEVQVKLLRVLQDRVVERLGSSQPIKVNVRVVAATNRDLEQAVADGAFREDLYYRLNVFPIRVPPLRERAEDIPALIWTFIDEFSRAFGKNIESLAKSSLEALQNYSWPGNVRELRNVIERAVIVSTGPRLVVEPPRPSSVLKRKSLKFADVEVDHIRSVLEATGWRVRGRGGAADLLGMKPTTLESRMAKLGIVRTGRHATERAAAAHSVRSRPERSRDHD
jgi:formate hydrogenlyase transcriptional activator